MNWPLSQDYNEAIQNAATNFSDPVLKSGEVVVNAIGLPVPRSGNFADVYQFKGGDGKMWAVKCFTRKVAGLEERYAKIDEHLRKARLPFTVGFKYMPQGIRVKGQWYPLLKMEWVEGFTLNDFVSQNLDKPNYLHALMQMWGKLTVRLRDARVTHADLQHGNVLLVPGNTPAKLGLKLIDYDGMWVPALAGSHSGEVGHPNFQHPERLRDKLYNEDVDRFPHLVIACALRATLVGGKAIWDKYDNSDNLLFRESDLRDPANAPIFKALWNLNDEVLRALVGHIAISAKQPLKSTPWLDDLLFNPKGVHLTPELERQTVSLLGIAPPQAGVKPTAAAPAVQAQFNLFELTDDEGDGALPDPSVRRRYSSGGAATRYGRKPKSKAPLVVGAVVLGVVLIGVMMAVKSAGKRTPTQPESVQHDPKGKTKTPDPAVKKEPVVETPIVKKEPKEAKEPKEPAVATASKSIVGFGSALVHLPGAEPITKETVIAPVKTPAFRPIQQAALNGGAVERMSFSTDGKHLCLLQKGSIAIIDAETAAEMHRFNVDGTVRDLEFGLGKEMYISFTTGRFEAWDWEQGKALRTFDAVEQKTSPVQLILQTADPGRMLVTTATPELYWWDVAKWSIADRFAPFPGTAIDHAASFPDGSRVLIRLAGKDARLVVWDLASKRELLALDKVEMKNLFRIEVSPNGNWITGLSHDGGGQVFVWDAKSGKLKHTLPGLKTNNVSGGFSAGGDYFIVNEPARRLLVNLELGTLSDASRKDPAARVAATLPAESLFATANADSKLRIWRIEIDSKPAVVAKVKTPEPKEAPKEKSALVKQSVELMGTPNICIFSPSGKRIVATTGEGPIHILDAGSLEVVAQRNLQKCNVLQLTMTPASNVGKGRAELAFVFDDRRQLRIIDLEKGESRTHSLRSLLDDKVNYQLVVTPNTAITALLHPDMGESHFVDQVKGTELPLQQIGKHPIGKSTRAMAITPDARFAAAYGAKKLVVWNFSASQPVCTFDTPELRAIVLVPNASAVLGADGGNLLVWDFGKGKELAKIDPHGNDDQFLLAGSPKGTIAATAGADKTIRIWDVLTGKEVAKWPVENVVKTIAISPDGKFAATTDGTTNKVSLWAMPESGKKP